MRSRVVLLLVAACLVVFATGGDAAASRRAARKVTTAPSRGEGRTYATGRGKVRVEITFGRRPAAQKRPAAARPPRQAPAAGRAISRRQALYRRVEPLLTPASVAIVLATQGLPLWAALVGAGMSYGAQQALRWVGRQLDARRAAREDRP